MHVAERELPQKMVKIVKKKVEFISQSFTS